MAIYTSEYLRGLANNNSRKIRMFSLNESIQEHTYFDIFLSHSYLDREVVGGLYFDLTNRGFKVYVDWIIDPHLDRKNVTKESAAHIRNRIKISKALLLAVSTNASVSKWMPWELGYSDGLTSQCAVIPVSPDTVAPKSYKGFEYLSLYPFIKIAQTEDNISKLWVVEDKNRYVMLDNWVSYGTAPFDRKNSIF